MTKPEARDPLNDGLTPALTAGLDAARQRGRQQALRLFNAPDVLTPAEVCARTGWPEQRLEAYRRQGLIYALVLGDGPHSRRYPAWQFAIPAARLAQVLQPFVACGVNCWVLHQFLVSAHVALARSPAQALAGAARDLQTVLDLARDLCGTSRATGLA